MYNLPYTTPVQLELLSLRFPWRGCSKQSGLIDPWCSIAQDTPQTAPLVYARGAIVEQRGGGEMERTAPICPKCGGTMQAGFIADFGHGGTVKPSDWVVGRPQRSFWFGTRVRDRQRFRVTAYRCGQCGYLELYARDEV